MKIAIGCLFLLVALHVYLAPFTKVEESFNLQATHDLLNNVDHFDHLDFPGVVPRTFFGAILLCVLSWPIAHHVPISLIEQQMLVRIILGLSVVLGLGRLAQGVKALFGPRTALITVLLFLCQFHLVFWSSRTLPNTIAMPFVELGLYHWLQSLSQTGGRTGHLAWMIRYLTFAGVVFRFEIGILLVILLGFEYYYQTVTIKMVVKNMLVTALLSLCITVPIDSYFWKTWLWPEGMVFYFNVILNKSSDWGTLPFYAYFLSFLPRLLLVSYPVACIAYGVDQRVRRMLNPMLVYILIFSFLPHKEWRFIMYTIPIFTAAAATFITWTIQSARRSWIYRFLMVGLFIASVGSFMISTLMLQISRLNYPGGEALQQLHELESSKTKVHVHLDAETAMTGASLYGQKNANWRYSKNEQHKNKEEFIQARYTHLITADPHQFGEEFETMSVIEGLDRVQLKSLSEISIKDWSPIKFRMAPKLYILRSIHPQKTWIKSILHNHPVVLFSKTYCPYCRGVKQILSKYCKDIRVIEVDLEADGAEIKAGLYELTGRATFPNLFKNGKSLGGFDNVSILDREGKLRDLCVASY